jgi:hypothetical protein
VGDLVAQHRGEFGLGVEVGQQAAVDVDVAAAGGEGVDRALVHHRELPLEVGHVAAARDTLADLVHVVLDGLVFVDAVVADDLVVGAARGFTLAGLGAEDDVAAAGGGIAGAGDEARARRERGEEDEAGAGGHRRPHAPAGQRPAAAYFLRNLSTRPAVSTIFCLPV